MQAPVQDSYTPPCGVADEGAPALPPGPNVAPQGARATTAGPYREPPEEYRAGVEAALKRHADREAERDLRWAKAHCEAEEAFMAFERAIAPIKVHRTDIGSARNGSLTTRTWWLKLYLEPTELGVECESICALQWSDGCWPHLNTTPGWLIINTTDFAAPTMREILCHVMTWPSFGRQLTKLRAKAEAQSAAEIKAEIVTLSGAAMPPVSRGVVIASTLGWVAVIGVVSAMLLCGCG